MTFLQDRVFMTLLTLGSIGFFLGVFMSYKAAGNSEVQSITCAQGYLGAETRDWLELTDCELSLPSAVMLMDGDKVQALYVPLYPNNKAVVPAMFFLKTADPELIAVVQELDALRTDEEAWITAIESDLERTVPIRTVRGLTISAYSENNKNALDLIENKHDELVLVADGKEPHPLLGAVLLLLGLGLWGGAGYRYKQVS